MCIILLSLYDMRKPEVRNIEEMFQAIMEN